MQLSTFFSQRTGNRLSTRRHAWMKPFIVQPIERR